MAENSACAAPLCGGTPAAQLRLRYALLFPQEFDDIVPFAFEPAEQLK
jgi:hypothetical protein